MSSSLEQGSTCRNCSDDIHCSVVSSASQLFFTAAGSGHRVREVPALNCIEIILYIYCQALFLLARWHVLCWEVCLEGKMQFFCSGDPCSWPSGCQHRSAEKQSDAERGRGWLAARAVAPTRARVISSCSSNSELVCYVFLMYPLGQHYKGTSQEFVYDASQRGFVLCL